MLASQIYRALGRYLLWSTKSVELFAMKSCFKNNQCWSSALLTREIPMPSHQDTHSWRLRSQQTCRIWSNAKIDRPASMLSSWLLTRKISMLRPPEPRTWCLRTERMCKIWTPSTRDYAEKLKKCVGVKKSKDFLPTTSPDTSHLGAHPLASGVMRAS